MDEHHIAPDTGCPNELTDLFGLEVLEFDPLPPGEENHLTFKGAFPTSHLHPAKLWCDIIEPKGCQILANYAKDFYAGRPAMTMNAFGLGKAHLHRDAEPPTFLSRPRLVAAAVAAIFIPCSKSRKMSRSA